MENNKITTYSNIVQAKGMASTVFVCIAIKLKIMEQV